MLLLLLRNQVLLSLQSAILEALQAVGGDQTVGVAVQWEEPYGGRSCKVGGAVSRRGRKQGRGVMRKEVTFSEKLTFLERIQWNQ